MICEKRPHGEWSGEPERRKMVTRVCTACGERGAVGHYCMWCGAYDGESPRRDEKYDPDVIKGKDEKGYFVMERECIHTDGTPDEWEKIYYKPLPKEGDKE